MPEHSPQPLKSPTPPLASKIQVTAEKRKQKSVFDVKFVFNSLE